MTHQFIGQALGNVPEITDPLSVISLDLTGNQLSNLESLQFENLETLTLDENGLTDLELPHILPHLKTLSLNKNYLENVEFIEDLALKAPQLEYLSLLFNPCNDFLAPVSDQDARLRYVRFRKFCAGKFPNLKVLDCQEITEDERRDAAYYETAAKVTQTTSAAVPSQRKVIAATAETETESNSKTRFGRLRYYYNNESSEGNRFIKEDML
ncbi:hypothetical protein PCE1_000733 [Barthelona sp. PCE]